MIFIERTSASAAARSFGDCCLTIPCRQVLVGKKSPWNSRWKTDPKQQSNQKRISGLTSQVETYRIIIDPSSVFICVFAFWDGNGWEWKVFCRRAWKKLRATSCRWQKWRWGDDFDCMAGTGNSVRIPKGSGVTMCHWKPECTDFSHLLTHIRKIGKFQNVSNNVQLCSVTVTSVIFQAFPRSVVFGTWILISNRLEEIGWSNRKKLWCCSSAAAWMCLKMVPNIAK